MVLPFILSSWAEGACAQDHEHPLPRPSPAPCHPSLGPWRAERSSEQGEAPTLVLSLPHLQAPIVALGVCSVALFFEGVPCL